MRTNMRVQQAICLGLGHKAHKNGGHMWNEGVNTWMKGARSNLVWAKGTMPIKMNPREQGNKLRSNSFILHISDPFSRVTWMKYKSQTLSHRRSPPAAVEPQLTLKPHQNGRLLLLSPNLESNQTKTQPKIQTKLGDTWTLETWSRNSTMIIWNLSPEA